MNILYFQNAITKAFLGVLLVLPLASCVNQTTSVSSARVVETGAYVEIDRSIAGIGESVSVTLRPSTLSSGADSTSLKSTEVTFFTSGGTSRGSFGNLIENFDGSVSTTFTGTNSGTETYIKATLRGQTVESFNNPSIRITPGDYSVANSQVTLDNAAPAAGSTVNITVASFDSTGAAKTSGGLSVACTGKTGAEIRAASAVVDNNDGTYSTAFQARKASVATEITCRLNGLLIVDTATFTATAGSATRLSLSSGNSQTSAVITDLSPFVVKVTDDFDNIIQNEAIDWSVTNWTGSGTSGTLSGASSNSNASGLASITHTFGTSTGSISVRARITSNTSTSLSFTAQATAGAASTLDKLTGDSQSAPINKAFSESLKVQVKDANGNPVKDTNITWTLSTGTGSLVFSPTSGISKTDSTGIASIVISSYSKMEPFQVRARLNGATEVLFTNLLARLGDPSKIRILAGNNQRKQTSKDLNTTFKVAVEDSDSNLLPDSPLTWTIVSGGGSFPAGATALTNVNGEATGAFRNGIAPGTFNVKVASQTHPGVFANFSVEAFEGTPTALVSDSGHLQEVVVGEVSQPLVIQLRDEQDVPLRNKTIRWTVLSAGNTIVSSNPTTNNAGESWVQIQTTENSVGNVNVKAELIYPTGVPSFTFTIKVVYHSLAAEYFGIMQTAGKTITDSNKKIINNFAKGLESIGIIGGDSPALREIWLMRKQFNKGSGNTVYGMLGQSNITLQNRTDAQWDAEADIANRYGICFLNNNQWGTTGVKSRDNVYNTRSLTMIVQRINTNGVESYMQTSNQSFDESINQPGKGFKIGKEVGWGNDNLKDWDANTGAGDFATMNLNIPLTIPTFIHSQVNSGTVSTFTNSYNKVTRTIDVDDMGDSNLISIARKDKTNGAGSRGLDGCMPFAMDMSKSLSDSKVTDLYNLVRDTVGQGMGLP